MASEIPLPQTVILDEGDNGVPVFQPGGADDLHRQDRLLGIAVKLLQEHLRGPLRVQRGEKQAQFALKFALQVGLRLQDGRGSSRADWMAGASAFVATIFKTSRSS